MTCSLPVPAAACSPEGITRRSAWVIVLAGLVPVHLLLLAWLACRMSPTADEAAHLAAGIRLWQTGRFDLYLVNPPLVKAIAALPVMLDPPQVDWQHVSTRAGERNEWLVGLDSMRANPQRFRWDLILARWCCLPFSVLGLVYCTRWAMDLFGPTAGILSACAWCISPNVLGNAALITTDVPAAATGVAALYHFRNWLRSHDGKQSILAGLWMGTALLTKFIWVLFLPLLPLLWLVSVGQESSSRGLLNWNGLAWLRRDAGPLLLMLFLTLDLMHAGYGFTGLLQPLKEFEFVSQVLGAQPKPGSQGGSGGEGTLPGNRFRDSLPGELPVPVPAAWLQGIDLQQRDFEGGWKPLYSYLNGELRLHGWWHYYLSAGLVKTTPGGWIIAVAAIVALAPLLRRRDARAEVLCVLLPALLIMLAVSAQTGFSRSFRYVLPAFPFVFILLGAAWGTVASRRVRSVALVGLLLATMGSLQVYPHSLAYFNSLAGGPLNGHRYLLDSNLDWGQDLYSLKEWQVQNPQARPLHLAYSGVADPRLFQIDAEPLSAKGLPSFSPGWYAISANHLHGYDVPDSSLTRFLPLTPVDHAGYSILIYHLREPLP
jgi:hypothetical protein